MERTYNVFVDNGLFVAANLLNKSVKDVTIEDLKNNDNINFFAERIHQFISCKKYSKIAGMSFHNSAFDQPAFKNNRLEKIKEQFKTIMDNTGEDEYCCICGQKHIKFDKSDDFLSKLNRAFIINSVADTFYNHSNNLHTVNVCPACILLGMISILNMRKSGYLVLYNSENYDFMMNLTNERQREIINDIAMDVGGENNTLKLQEEILNFIVEKKRRRNNLKIYKISNSKKEFYEEEILSTRDLDLFYEIYVEDLLNEFNETGLFYNMLKGNLKNVYMYKLIDFQKCELRCSKELLILIDGRLNKMSKEVNDLIRTICAKVSELDVKDALTQIKNVSSYNKFMELILRWQEVCKNQKNADLLKCQEEFDLITDRKHYFDIKNKIMFELILNK